MPLMHKTNHSMKNERAVRSKSPLVGYNLQRARKSISKTKKHALAVGKLDFDGLNKIPQVPR